MTVAPKVIFDPSSLLCVLALCFKETVGLQKCYPGFKVATEELIFMFINNYFSDHIWFYECRQQGKRPAKRNKNQPEE